MKQLLTSLLLFAVALSAAAQGQHIKFMGLPLDGTISQFEQKLVAKGFKNDRQLNAQIMEPFRVFRGTFAGHSAMVHINYDAKTKIVYRAKVIVESSTESACNSIFNEFYNNISNKYNDWYCEKNEVFGSSATYSWAGDIGEIDLFRTEDYDVYPNAYYVHIDYYDAINNAKHEESNSSDF